MPQAEPHGRVHAVRGVVVDVRYDAGTLPALNTALTVEWDRPGPLLLEVQSHLDMSTLRAVALQATADLVRGVTVQSTGAPITVPVGRAVLGRLLDVTGEVRDLGEPLDGDVPRRSIHAAPPAASREIEEELGILEALVRRIRQEAITAEIIEISAGAMMGAG